VSASSAHYLDAAAAFPGLNREFSLTLATGLPAGVDDDGPRSRAVRLSSGWDLPSIYRPWEPLLVHGAKDCAWPSPSPDGGKVAATRELRHTVDVFTGSPDGWEPLDASASAASQGPAPTPQFSRTSSIDIKV
jgi:hypothetical protein